MSSRKKKRVEPWMKMTQMLLFPVALVWLEVVFHIGIYKNVDAYIVFPVLFAVSVGALLTFLIGGLKHKVAKVVTWIVLALTSVLYMTQAVYYGIFKTFLTIYMMLGNAGDATEFWREGLSGIWAKLPVVLLLAVPMIVYGVLLKRGYFHRKMPTEYRVANFAMCTAALSLAFCLFSTEAGRTVGLKSLYFDEWQIDRGFKQLGVLTGSMQDVKMCITYDTDVSDDVEYVGLPSISLGTPTPTKAPEVTKEPDATATPTPTPIDTSPNIINIDFAALVEDSKNDSIKAINEYMAAATPTNKNEYTGMFEGYNLIMLTCEGFSPWAVDEEVTPTLYKLVHEGFYFKNFYTPIWITSTSDGEYAACTGLLPDLKKNNSFKRSADVSMPLCLGHVFGKLGYSTNAYHNNSYTYYGRNKSHPNMGYTFTAVGNGLEISKAWPASDLEMMQATVSQYISDGQFHAYYMTVSGHLEYTFNGNSMAKKNKDAVANLPYSDHCKAYIACNVELDKAMEYLIDQLELAGVADKTVIVMSSDHYPYGLTIEEIEEIQGGDVEETFELYRNHLVIWSASMEEPIEVEKYCSSVDIVPTICNLFGIEYDSRLYIGSDILSTAPALVLFKDSSFITDYCKYNAGNGKITMLADVELPEGYIDTVKSIVRNKFSISRGILNNNYYSTIEKYLP